MARRHGYMYYIKIQASYVSPADFQLDHLTTLQNFQDSCKFFRFCAENFGRDEIGTRRIFGGWITNSIVYKCAACPCSLSFNPLLSFVRVNVLYSKQAVLFRGMASSERFFTLPVLPFLFEHSLYIYFYKHEHMHIFLTLRIHHGFLLSLFTKISALSANHKIKLYYHLHYNCTSDMLCIPSITPSYSPQALPSVFKSVMDLRQKICWTVLEHMMDMEKLKNIIFFC